MLKALRPLATFTEGWIDRIGGLTAWIALVMIGLWMAMANLALLQIAHERWPSRDRWGAPMDRLDPWLFLELAAAGASPAAWTALWTRHAGRQQKALLPRLLNITGIQIGLVIGALWWWIAG